MFAGNVARAAEPAGAATEQLLQAMRCACMHNGARTFNTESPVKTLLDCPCDDDGQGGQMRARVEAYMKVQPPTAVADGSAQMAFLEQITQEDPANERYAIYSVDDHTYLMKNTLCTCGCGKMALSQCPLDCPWSPRFKRQFKYLLATGHSVPEARSHYVKAANEVHLEEGETPLSPDDVLLNQESALSWALPVAFFAFFVMGLIAVLSMRSRRRAAATASGAPSDGLSDSDRALLEDELEMGDDT